MIQHPNPLKQIIDDIKARLDVLEVDMKTIKWISSEALKMVEQNELVIKGLSEDIQEVASIRIKRNTDPVVALKPERKIIRKRIKTEKL